jgi:transcriptional regulator with XRE-family HTH domain
MIHRALKLLRNYHNLKQKDLAEKLQVSPSHLSEIESGQKTVTFELLMKYAVIFDVPVSSIALFAERVDGSRTNRLEQSVAEKALRMMEWLETITRYNNRQEGADEKCG